MIDQSSADQISYRARSSNNNNYFNCNKDVLAIFIFKSKRNYLNQNILADM